MAVQPFPVELWRSKSIVVVHFFGEGVPRLKACKLEFIYLFRLERLHTGETASCVKDCQGLLKVFGSSHSSNELFLRAAL